MKFPGRVLAMSVFALMPFVALPGQAQANPEKSQSNTAASAEKNTQEANMQEYINLLRSDVRQQKAEIIGSGDGAERPRCCQVLADL